MSQDPARKVLVAEDNPTVRNLLKLSLKKWGCEVLIADNGKDAWEILRTLDEPILAILDWQMPGLTGVEICRKVQQRGDKIPPYLILLTSLDAKENIVEGLGAGANDFIPKSCDMDVLRARLEVGYRSLDLQTRLANDLKGNDVNTFKEKEEMEKTILALKQKALELEKRLASNGKGKTQRSGPETDTSILDEIVVVFKRGEINLPSPPQIGIRFKQMMDSGANLQQIGKLLKQDTSVTAKLISISNSAFYRGVADNKTLEQAVGRLGLKTTKQYVDAITNRSLYYTKNKNMKAFIERLWEHSLASAYASQIICQLQEINSLHDPFTLGLLHDIGRLVLLQAVGDLQLKNKLGSEVDKEELSSTLDSNHGKFGAALLRRWKFADEYIQIANCHDDVENGDTITNELLVVHLANLLVKSMGYFSFDSIEIDLESSPAVERLSLDEEGISIIKNRVQSMMDEMKGHFA